MSNTSRIAKNTIFLYIRSFVTLLISLYTSRVILEVLGVEDYGIYNVVGGVIGILSFLNTSMASTYQRYFNYEMGRRNEKAVTDLFKSSLTVQLFYALIIVLIAETFGLWFLENKLVITPERMVAARWVYHISIVSFVLTVFQAPFNALIISYEKMEIFAYISILDSLLKLVIALTLPLFVGDKLIVYVFLGLSIMLINSIIYLFVCKSKFSACQLGFNWNLGNLKSLLGFGTWGMLDSLSYVLINQGINIILNVFFGLVVNAARGIAYQVMGAVNQFIFSFQTAFRPQIIKSYGEGDISYMFKIYYTSTKMSCYMIWLLSLPIIMETPMILKIWLGDNVPEYTVAFIRIILLTALINVYANPTTCMAYATGNIKWFNIIVSGLNLLNVPVVYFFLKCGYGPVSAMVICLFFAVLVQAARLGVMTYLMPFSIKTYIWETVFPTAIVVVLSFIISLCVKTILSTSLLYSFLVCIVSLLSVTICSWIWGLTKEERTVLTIKCKHLKNKGRNHI